MAKEKEVAQSNTEIIDALKVKADIPPAWGDLAKEYYPSRHPVMDRSLYPDKVSGNKVIKVTRATRGMQRRAVKIMTGLMFGLPVERVYTMRNDKDQSQILACSILEDILTSNRIDALNIDRGIKLFASCEAATIWYAVKETNDLYGPTSLLKLRNRTYSPMTGEMIYPLRDENDDLVALSFEYTVTERERKETYFDCYEKDLFRKWKRGDSDWELIESKPIIIGKIPGAYIFRSTPIYEESGNVNEIEMTLSRNGNYLRKNSVPIFEVCDDEKIEFGQEKSDDERVIINLSSKGSSSYKTWDQATESLKFQMEQLENGYYVDLQLPNFASADIKGMALSGESKRYMSMDAHMKTREEQGAWLEFFSREINVVRAFAKIMFPQIAAAFDQIRVKSIITPFSITNEKDTISNCASATGGKAIASVRSAISRLGWATDVDKEMEEIAKDEAIDVIEPTI